MICAVGRPCLVPSIPGNRLSAGVGDPPCFAVGDPNIEVGVHEIELNSGARSIVRVDTHEVK